MMSRTGTARFDRLITTGYLDFLHFATNVPSWILLKLVVNVVKNVESTYTL